MYTWLEKPDPRPEWRRPNIPGHRQDRTSNAKMLRSPYPRHSRKPMQRLRFPWPHKSHLVERTSHKANVNWSPWLVLFYVEVPSSSLMRQLVPSILPPILKSRPPSGKSSLNLYYWPASALCTDFFKTTLIRFGNQSRTASALWLTMTVWLFWIKARYLSWKSASSLHLTSSLDRRIRHSLESDTEGSRILQGNVPPKRNIRGTRSCCKGEGCPW